MEDNRENHVAKTIQDGIGRLEKSQTVLFATAGILNGAIKQNPKIAQKLRTFGETKVSYNCLLFNENSPLVPLFLKAATESFERGQYDYMHSKWLGTQISHVETVTASIVGTGQVFVVFVILTAMLACSLACLMIECMYFYITRKKFLSPSNGPIPPILPNSEGENKDDNERGEVNQKDEEKSITIRAKNFH